MPRRSRPVEPRAQSSRALRSWIPSLAERIAAAGLLAALSLVPVRLSTPGNGGDLRARRAAFPLEGWTYGKIGEAPEADRYRLRLDVTLRPERARQLAQVIAADECAEPDMLFPEFRLLLERTGDHDFACLRCADGHLELARVVGGEFVESTGKPRTPLPFLSELLRPGAVGTTAGAARPGGKPLTLKFCVDRSPGRWAVSLFGEEVLAIHDRRPSAGARALQPKRPLRRSRPGPRSSNVRPAGEFAWSATPGWRLEARSIQPLEQIAFDDAFERESFREDGEYDLVSGDWRLDSVRDVERTVNAFRLRGSAPGGTPAVVTVGHDFWRDYRVGVSIRFPEPGTGGLVFAGGAGQKFGVLRWSCPPPDRPSAEGKDSRGRSLLEILEVSPFAPPEWAKPSPARQVEQVMVSLPWRPRLNQWYRVAVSVSHETGEVDVNGRRVAFRLPPGLRSGTCGLYSESAKGVLFDDLTVRSNRELVYTRGDLVGPLVESPGQRAGGWAQVHGLPEGPVRFSIRPARGANALALRWPVQGAGTRLQLVLVGATGKGALELERESGRPGLGLGCFDLPPGLLRREVGIEIAEETCSVLDGANVAALHRLPACRTGPVEILQYFKGGVPGLNRLAAGPLPATAPLRHKSHAFEKVDVTVNKKGEKYPERRWGGFVGWIEDRGAWDVSGGPPSSHVRFRAPIWGDVDCELNTSRPTGEGEDAAVGLHLVPDGEPEGTLGLSLVREPDGVVVVDPNGNVLGRYSDDQGARSTRFKKAAEGKPGRQARRLTRAQRERRWIEKRAPDEPLLCYLLGREREDVRPLQGRLLQENPKPQSAGLALTAQNDVRHTPRGVRIKDGGKLFSVDAGRRLAERIRRTGAFSVEAVVTPADTAHGGPARIVSLSRDGGVRNFTLGQEGGSWVVRVRTSENNQNGTAPELRMDGLHPRRAHVVVTYDGEAVRFYLDGELKEARNEVRGDLDGWDPSYALVLGNEFAEPRNWAGVIRFVAFYDRALSAEDVRAAARNPPPGEAPAGPVRTRKDDTPRRPVRIRLRRLAGEVEASVDGETVFAAALGERVPVRVEARGPEVSPKDLAIRAPRVDESLFEAAPTEWLRWRGHWDMTTKWQCDPRWSFVGLWSDAADTKREAAGLFSRASYLGDQYLHFNFAFRDMLNAKVEKRRYIRRDLNFAFCCDGKDLTSGYCVLFGGFDNRGTQLLRRGELVAENKGVRFPTFRGGVHDIHWNWYSLEIVRRGGDIAVMIDGKTVIEWRDSEPLDGGHVAAWVLGGGMILGRTRFSAERRGPELAGFSADPVAAPPDGWRLLDRDHPAQIERTRTGAVRVTNPAGGGHFAAEVRANARFKVLAFRASESTLVRARLYAVGKEGPVRLLPGGKDPLTADGEWHVLPLGLSKGELDRVRFGNWSAEGYLAAGIGGNPAGAWYEVMLFPTLDAARRFCRSAAREEPF